MLHNIDVNKAGPRGEAMAEAVGTCVHCGFCLPACPTYQELESEMDSPRGRILLMKSALEGSLTVEEAEPHVDRCLGCLACVTHCPSGVEYGELLSSYRALTRKEKKTRQSIGEKVRDQLVSLTLPHAKRFRWAVRLGHAFSPLQGLMPKALKPMLGLLPKQLPQDLEIPQRTPAVGTRRAKVALLSGCAQQVLAPDINLAAIRVLSRNGIDVVVPPGQGCCGALNWHSGEAQSAIGHAEKLISSMPNDVDCIVSTAAGCGSAIQEYPLLLKGRESEAKAKQFSQHTKDVSVFLHEIGLSEEPRLERRTKIAYHDACHLAHAQQIRNQPRELLKAIGNAELIELADSDTCCGSAGTYNIEQPELAERLGRRKATNIQNAQCDWVATGNIGCLVQIEKQLEKLQESIPVLHTMQVLDRAYHKTAK